MQDIENQRHNFMAPRWHSPNRPRAATKKKAPKGTKRTNMKPNNTYNNKPQTTAQTLAGQPQTAAPACSAGTTQNPSSIKIHRLTQYSAIRSTMYCKVPVFDIIFVMQAG